MNLFVIMAARPLDFNCTSLTLHGDDVMRDEPVGTAEKSRRALTLNS